MQIVLLLKRYVIWDVKDVTENKRFWKTIKPFFTDKTKNSKTKTKNSNNSILTQNYQTIREDEVWLKTIRFDCANNIIFRDRLKRKNPVSKMLFYWPTIFFIFKRFGFTYLSKLEAFGDIGKISIEYFTNFLIFPYGLEIFS